MSTARVCGHFGELLQGRLGPEGPVVLITLPCPFLKAEVSIAPAPHLTIEGPGAALLPVERAAILLERLDVLPALDVHVSADMRPGSGAGSSTAVLLALARAAGFDGDPTLALLAAEGASDPLMHSAPEALLWASRSGRIIEQLPPLPAFEVIGGFLDGGEVTDPADTGFPDISDLVEGWRGAGGDPMRIAQIASASARRTTALRGPKDDLAEGLAKHLGALGYIRAHTGTARGFLFAPGSVPKGAEHELERAGLSRILRFRAGAQA